LEIVSARDGNEALQAFRREASPVLAIFDWVMPGLDGLELCRRVRKEAKLAYILLLTARGGTQNIRQALQAGADDYLVKRISQEELSVRLRLGIRILSLEAQLAAQAVELVGTTG
jgi:DNA-binding response OmpR family regulator